MSMVRRRDLVQIQAVIWCAAAAAAARTTSLSRATANSTQWPTRDSVPLNQFPFILTHDSATGYLGSDPVDWWAKTQTVGFGGQAACGARAFDVRPLAHADGTVTMHHADVSVGVALSTAVAELIPFANANPNELLLLYVSHCAGTLDCQARTLDVLNRTGVPTCADGGALAGATYGSAKAMGRLAGGGAMLAIFGFVEENYDASITCYNGPAPAGHCYGGQAGQDAAFQPLWSYLRAHGAPAPAATGELRMLQAHWQYDAASIAQGVLFASSILDDESRASVNSQLADAVTCSPCPGPDGKGVFTAFANLIEVDNVCDSGGKLYNALRTKVP